MYRSSRPAKASKRGLRYGLLMLVMLMALGGRTAAEAQQVLPVDVGKWTSFHFVHPGLLNSLAELDAIKKHIAEGQEPWSSEFQKLKAASRLPYRPTPFAEVSQGFGGASDHGFDEEMRDANAAYSFALVWVLTGDEAYAAASGAILDAWSSTLRSHAGANWYLETAWAGAVWPLSAELLKATYGQKWHGAQQFGKMLNDVFLPALHNRLAFGNREFAVINALIAIGIFNEDRAAFVEGLNHFNTYVPEYYYLTEDGPTPHIPDYWTTTPPDADLRALDVGKAPADWKPWIDASQANYNADALRTLHQGDDHTALEKALATGDGMPLWGVKVGTYINGYSPEIGGRDLGHAESAFGSTINAAEMASHQKIDLYSGNAKRFSAFVETLAGLRLGAPPPPETYGGIVGPGNGLTPVYETAYDHLHNVMKLNLPQTSKLITSVFRKIQLMPYIKGVQTGRLWTYPPPLPPLFTPVVQGQVGWITSWDTLTHGDLHRAN